MPVVRVPVRELLHHSREVFARVSAGERVEITRRGRVVAVLSAPAPDEVAMDELTETGQVRPGWRERQTQLHRTLQDLPVRSATADRRAGSDAVLADREDER